MILTCMRWYVAYPLSYRHVEELMEERGVPVDHATINRVMRFSKTPYAHRLHSTSCKSVIASEHYLDSTTMKLLVPLFGSTE
jgi:putative transposase